jgi:hypothetical protein
MEQSHARWFVAAKTNEVKSFKVLLNHAPALSAILHAMLLKLAVRTISRRSRRARTVPSKHALSGRWCWTEAATSLQG